MDKEHALEFGEWIELTESGVLERLETSEGGLAEAEAEKRLKEYGSNEIASGKITWWHILIRQFRSPFVYLLLAALGLALLLGEFIDGAMILLFIGINAVLGFFQEYRSEQTVKLLQRYLVSKTSVWRGGKLGRIEVTKLVPGDVVMLEPGDLVPADMRFIKSQDLTLDESVLSGEAAPVEKIHAAAQRGEGDMYKARNIGFSGTLVATGEATGVVVATGKKTMYGDIAELASQTVRESSYEKQIKVFSKFTLELVLATLTLVILASLVIKDTPSLAELVLFSLALAVSVIPEALPVVTTFCLSIGASRLAKKGVVVKRLSAIEDLGAIEVLCSDKTGTLTENVMTVEEVYPTRIATEVLVSAHLVSSAVDSNKGNNAFDEAIENKLKRTEHARLEKFVRLAEMPFDPIRKRASIVVREGKTDYLITRGAPEEVMAICKKMSPGQKREILKEITAKGKEGKRVLAVARREFEGYKNEPVEGLEKELEFLGLVAFVDPIKESTFRAVKQAKKLGLGIKILTGDSKEVAGSVAAAIGLIEEAGEVINGNDFEDLPIEKQRQAVERYHVFSRVTPQQKYQIIKLLEEKHEVGFLGEGINDAPALKIANVALVVDEASDIAKEASDILLLKKSLEVIVDGIKEGRKVFANTSKYITATLASNFGNFFAVAAASLVIDYLPMLPLQILLLNLLSDFPTIAIATDSVDAESLATPSRYSLRSFASIALFFGMVSTLFDFIFFGVFVRTSPEGLRTSWFIGSILTEILFLFLVRTRRFFLQAKRPSGILIGLTALTFLVTVGLPYTRLGTEWFGFIPLSAWSMAGVMLIVLAYLLATEGVKRLYYRYAGAAGIA